MKKRFWVWGIVLGFVLLHIVPSEGGLYESESAPGKAGPAKAVLQTPAGEGVKEQNLQYVLGPEDVLQISVWKDQELTREVIVDPDGHFSFPLAGQISAAGRTVPEIETELREKLAVYVSEPVVTVLLRKVQSYKIYVIGKVSRPGFFVLGDRINVMQALSMAGGLTPFASPGKIVVLREGEKGQQRFSFDYDDVAEGESLEQNIELKNGDVVVVP
ncbi:MAG: polysaccharide biosynthesis/export family protein [Pseudomonadota bacterium]